MEINLGNNEEGFGEEQPLIKGEMAPAQEAAVQPQRVVAEKEAPAKDLEPDENAEADAAPITKPVKPAPKTKNIAKEPITQPVKTNTTTTVVASTANGRIALDAVNGRITVTLSDTVTAAIGAARYAYDLVLDSGSIVTRILEGKFVVTGAVTV